MCLSPRAPSESTHCRMTPACRPLPGSFGNYLDSVPQECTVRIYIVRGLELQPQDNNGPGKSLGVGPFSSSKIITVFNHRNCHVPSFCVCYLRGERYSIKTICSGGRPSGDLSKSLKGRGFGASGSSFSFYRCDLRELLCHCSRPPPPPKALWLHGAKREHYPDLI